MNITLQKLTKNNYVAAMKLTTNKTGEMSLVEDNLVSNAFSIAQASFYPNEKIKTIYLNDEMIGFTMYGMAEQDNKLYISRFMIDYKHQKKGYGRKAFELLLEEIWQDKTVSNVYISIIPEAKNLEVFYKSFGFVNTGLYDFDEPIFILAK